MHIAFNYFSCVSERVYKKEKFIPTYKKFSYEKKKSVSSYTIRILINEWNYVMQFDT